MYISFRLHSKNVIFSSIPSRPTLRLGSHREDKENQGPSRGGPDPRSIGVPGPSGMIMIHEDDDEDGPILYRDDDDDEEDEGNFPEFWKKSGLICPDFSWMF